MNSLSRTMPFVATKEHVEAARTARESIAAYRDVEDLISIGAYKAGTQPASDAAIAKMPGLDAFLRQDKADPTDYAAAVQGLTAAASG
jgi:flagellum-specific ATP synthase